MASGPTGYQGNLTAEQEAKLKELWVALARVTGVNLDRMTTVRKSTDASTLHGSERGDPVDASPDPKKKRRFGLGGRKSNEKSAADPVEEDKYGQVKDYNEVIKEMTPEQLHNSFWAFAKADDPDTLLLRFLRARKWNVRNAMVMMLSTVRWRHKVVHVDDELVKTGEGGALASARGHGPLSEQMGNDFMQQLRIGKSFVHGLDNGGRPVCYIRVRLHRGSDQSQETIERFTVYVIETARMMLQKPIETAAIVFDLSGFSMANMDYTALKFMIKCFEANYPESLGQVFIWKAPWICNSIWAVVKGWLDPVVAAKVHFLKDVKELSTHIAIDRIPKEYGGQEDWTYKYIEPVEGENYMMKDDATREALWQERLAIVKEYEEVSMDWFDGIGGEETKAKRRALTQQLSENYWKMDPYVRAKTMYDRLGMIQDGGKIDMYPKSPLPTANGHAISADLAKVHLSDLHDDSDDDDDEFFDAVEHHL